MIFRIIRIIRIIRKNMFSQRPEMHGLSSDCWEAQPGRKSTESA